MSIVAGLLVVVGLILLSGFLAAAEVAILTSRRNRLETEARAGSRTAEIALEMADNPNRFLPALRVGVTLIGTLASVFSGAMLAPCVSEQLAESTWPLLAAHCEAVALGVVVLAVAFLTIVFADLAPKGLAAAHAERLARWAAFPLHWLAVGIRPLVGLTAAAAGGVLALAGCRQKPDAALATDDLEHLLRAGIRQGTIEPAEQMVARRALRLGDRTVRDIMRPRIEIDALDVDTPADEVIGAVAMAGFSRLPVHEGDLDHIIGFVYTKDLLLRQHMGWPIELRKLVRPALLVPETLRIDKLLERFRENRTQMALVLDEFGGTEGLVTMEDVLEELVGEIHDEHRQERELKIVAEDDGSFLVDAGVNIDDLLEQVGWQGHASSLSPDYSTVGGFIMSLLGRIPTAGDRAVWEGLALEVVDMEGRRVNRVRVEVVRKEKE
jgi:putative hemolysin